MINLNGTLVNTNDALIPINNRGLYYGDSVFETMRCFNGKPLFFEDHYFRLMSSMRIMRMEIPTTFTPEYLEEQIESLLQLNKIAHARIRLTVWRASDGFYTPLENTVSFTIVSSTLEGKFIALPFNEVELFKDYYIQASLLSAIKAANKHVNILAGIYGKENGYDTMILLNDSKMVAECIAGNIFIRNEDTIKTPPVKDGCLNGIMRNKVVEQLKKMVNYTIVEESVSPFELQRADEIFTTNVIQGVQNILKYRKKTYETTAATELRALFNDRLFP